MVAVTVGTLTEGSVTDIASVVLVLVDTYARCRATADTAVILAHGAGADDPFAGVALVVAALVGTLAEGLSAFVAEMVEIFV